MPGAQPLLGPGDGQVAPTGVDVPPEPEVVNVATAAPTTTPPPTVESACRAAAYKGHHEVTRRMRTAEEDEETEQWNKIRDLCKKEKAATKSLKKAIKEQAKLNRTLERQLTKYDKVKNDVKTTHDNIVRMGKVLDPDDVQT